MYYAIFSGGQLSNMYVYKSLTTSVAFDSTISFLGVNSEEITHDMGKKENTKVFYYKR